MKRSQIQVCDILVQLLQMAQAGKIDGMVFAIMQEDEGMIGAFGEMDQDDVMELLDKMYDEVTGEAIQPTVEYTGNLLQ